MKTDLQYEYELKIQALTQQETNAQMQMLQLRQDVAAANGQVLASESILRNQQALLRDVEHEASDRMSKLEDEMRDAAIQASLVQNQHDVQFKSAESAPFPLPTNIPREFTPVSPDSTMNHVRPKSDPSRIITPQPTSPADSETFMSPGERPSS